MGSSNLWAAATALEENTRSRYFSGGGKKIPREPGESGEWGWQSSVFGPRNGHLEPNVRNATTAAASGNRGLFYSFFGIVPESFRNLSPSFVSLSLAAGQIQDLSDEISRLKSAISHGETSGASGTAVTAPAVFGQERRGWTALAVRGAAKSS
jgi:hypothetical protein